MDYQVRPKKSPFAGAALILGIFAILSIPTVFFPLPLSALSILFAVLAHRRGKKWELSCIAGMVTSIVSLVISLTLIITSIAMIPTLLKTPAYRDQLNAISKQLYGESFDDVVEELYGVDLDALFDID